MESREHCKEKKVSSVTNVFGNICFCRALKMAPNVLDSQSEILLENFGEKAAWAYRGTAQFFDYLLLSQERIRVRTSSFVPTFIGWIGTKPIKISGTVAVVAVAVRDFRKFSRHPYIGRIARSCLR